MVNYLDDVGGELVDTLKKKEMWENTLFASSSDNRGQSTLGVGPTIKEENFQIGKVVFM